MRILVSLAAALVATGLGFAMPTAHAAPAPLLAQAQSADDVAVAIRDLYTRYYEALSISVANPDAQRPEEFEWTAISDRYFTPELAARFKKALASDEPVIDWDFFADGQDFGDLKVIGATATLTDDGATVVMRTSNFGTESTTNVLLTRATDGWRIKDFLFWAGTDNAMTLTTVLKEAGY